MSTQRPLVTVLMTVYNGGKYLKESVRSVLSQTFEDFEFLIINDCSTDDSVTVIKSFNDERIVIHNNERNLGQTRSLNVGLGLAKGKYIARMDADDMAFPLWLETLVNYAESNQEYVAVGAATAVMDESGKLKKVFRTPTTFEGLIFHIFFGNALNHVGSLFKKEIILKNGGYNEEFKISQDYELWSSLLRNKYRLINIEAILVAVRVHESSVGYAAEKNSGLMEVAQTVYRNINALTSLKVTLEDAIKLRTFYRFPEHLTFEEFKNTHGIYEKIFYSLKDGYKIEQSILKKKLKKQMMIPFCKRAIHEAEHSNRQVRRFMLEYFRRYGFHFIPFLMFSMSFFGSPVLKRLRGIYSRWQENVLKFVMNRS